MLSERISHNDGNVLYLCFPLASTSHMWLLTTILYNIDLDLELLDFTYEFLSEKQLFQALQLDKRQDTALKFCFLFPGQGSSISHMV